MRMGLVSPGAVQRVGRLTNDTGTGPVGAVSSDHINAPEQQRAGKGFGNAEQDFGSADLGHIDQRINARQYGYKLKGRGPAPPPRWSPRWFDFTSRIPWDSGRGTPPKAEQEAGGLPDGANYVTGQSALDRARRGET
jgi:hypothetical protein